LFSAKFTSLEQPDKEPLLSDTNIGSLDGTGQVGTYFYTAPEVAQGWPTIDEKVFSTLGHCCVDLWNKFVSYFCIKR
jgi:translation initiation factor 2-alpha kinase 4